MCSGVTVGRVAALALCAALAAPYAASAQTPLASILENNDANGDGKLGRDEAPVGMLWYFDDADADGDGQIDDFEAQRWDTRSFSGRTPDALEPTAEAEKRNERAGQPPQEIKTVRELIARLDRDRDGKLSIDEFPPRYRNSFGVMDLDKDGYIDARDAEIVDADAAARAAGPPPTGESGRRTIARVVQLMDTNGDGVLQKREAPIRLQQMWARFDLNGDGAIDMQEAMTPQAEETGGKRPGGR